MDGFRVWMDYASIHLKQVLQRAPRFAWGLRVVQAGQAKNGVIGMLHT
jgi:hypothetical protein